jgi:hypothetical protein
LAVGEEKRVWTCGGVEVGRDGRRNAGGREFLTPESRNEVGEATFAYYSISY